MTDNNKIIDRLNTTLIPYWPIAKRLLPTKAGIQFDNRRMGRQPFCRSGFSSVC